MMKFLNFLKKNWAVLVDALVKICTPKNSNEVIK